VLGKIARVKINKEAVFSMVFLGYGYMKIEMCTFLSFVISISSWQNVNANSLNCSRKFYF